MTALHRAIVLLLIALLPSLAWAQAQTPGGNVQLKEIQIAAEAFALAEPVPSWVDPISPPGTSEKQPIVLRLVDSQYLVGDKDRKSVV